jgi:hypothetical protein
MLSLSFLMLQKEKGGSIMLPLIDANKPGEREEKETKIFTCNMCTTPQRLHKF